MRLVLLTICLAACNQGLDVPIVADGGTTYSDSSVTYVDSGVTCAGFMDEASCLSAGCQVYPCARCPGDVGFPGCVAKSTGGSVSCAVGCAVLACEELTTQTDCDARTDCYALLTFDEMCARLGCESHFASCGTGPAACGSPISCDTNNAFVCDPGFTIIVDTAECPIGCVSDSSCQAP